MVRRSYHRRQPIGVAKKWFALRPETGLAIAVIAGLSAWISPRGEKPNEKRNAIAVDDIRTDKVTTYH